MNFTSLDKEFQRYQSCVTGASGQGQGTDCTCHTHLLSYPASLGRGPGEAGGPRCLVTCSQPPVLSFATLTGCWRSVSPLASKLQEGWAIFFTFRHYSPQYRAGIQDTKAALVLVSFQPLTAVFFNLSGPQFLGISSWFSWLPQLCRYNVTLVLLPGSCLRWLLPWIQCLWEFHHC